VSHRMSRYDAQYLRCNGECMGQELPIGLRGAAEICQTRARGCSETGWLQQAATLMSMQSCVHAGKVLLADLATVLVGVVPVTNAAHKLVWQCEMWRGQWNAT
jgi:hypothetical protein